MAPATTPTTAYPSSHLLQYLPAIYLEDAFLGQFLLAFEKVLFGRKDEVEPSLRGLEDIIAGISVLFDPEQTPAEFLPWLAGWTALSLRADLDIDQQRAFIAEIIQRYRWRGTRENLQKMLKIFTKGEPTITEDPNGPPFFFRVTINLFKVSDPEVLRRQLEIANAVIRLEKPAHTHYELVPQFPTLRIGTTSRVGVDTILGTIPTA